MIIYISLFSDYWEVIRHVKKLLMIFSFSHKGDGMTRGHKKISSRNSNDLKIPLWETLVYKASTYFSSYISGTTLRSGHQSTEHLFHLSLMSPGPLQCKTGMIAVYVCMMRHYEIIMTLPSSPEWVVLLVHDFAQQQCLPTSICCHRSLTNNMMIMYFIPAIISFLSSFLLNL